MALVSDETNYADEENYLSSPENCVLEEGKTGVVAKTSSVSAGSSSSVNSDQGLVFHQIADHYYPPGEEINDSLISFRGEYDHFMQGDKGSLVSFDHQQNYAKTSGGYSVLDGEISYGYSYWNRINDPRSMEDINCFETATSFGSITSGKAKDHGDWIHSSDTIHESASPEASTGFKRPHMGNNMKALKKHCSTGISSTATTSASKKNKPKASSTKDPQSLAAKNRRERISERLKILQELVPNGTKVDLVTMLEKAISYVKFLQLQVKVLATDEFWPVQGGKSPDISQVKEAIDAILSSQKDRTSCSK